MKEVYDPKDLEKYRVDVDLSNVEFDPETKKRLAQIEENLRRSARIAKDIWVD